MPEPYGAFGWICAHTPLPQCALFFNNLYRSSPPPLTFLFPSTSDFYKYYEVVDSSARGDPNVDAALRGAGAGLGGKCVIGRVGERGSIGDVALIVIAGLSAHLAVGLAAHATKRRAAVGRVEIRTLLLVYALHCILQCVSMSSMLQQGSTALLALASVHVAVVVVFFWVLLANGIIATQIVEDGTLAAIIPTTLVALALFGGTLYVALDTAFSFTSALDFADSEVGSLKAVALFSLTLVWPAIAATLYLILMVYITFKVLHERKPAFIYVGAFILFAIAQVIFFLASEPLCNGSGGKVNSAFLASILNTAALGLLYYAWISITEAEWADYDGYAYGQAY